MQREKNEANEENKGKNQPGVATRVSYDPLLPGVRVPSEQGQTGHGI